MAPSPAVGGQEAACSAPPVAAAAAAADGDACSSAQPDALSSGFCSELWASVAQPGGIFESILAHPFLTGLVEGTLPEQAFKFYIVQGALYLRQYARALAMVASKCPPERPQWTSFFGLAVSEAYHEETTFHSEFLAYYSTTVEAETRRAAPAPYCQLYSSWILSTVHERAFYEGLAAVLPCFVVYLEVARALKHKGSPHPLYQKFFDRFGGAEYEQLTMQVVRMANEVADQLSADQKQRMVQVFRHGCRLEWMFWDACLAQQEWPV